MRTQKNYYAILNARVDLNTDMLITELHKKLGKTKSELIRLIVTDFIIKNESILDEQIQTESDKDAILQSTFKGLYNISKSKYRKFKQYEETNITQ